VEGELAERLVKTCPMGVFDIEDLGKSQTGIDESQTGENPDWRKSQTGGKVRLGQKSDWGKSQTGIRRVRLGKSQTGGKVRLGLRKVRVGLRKSDWGKVRLWLRKFRLGLRKSQTWAEES
jgi:hypothetical protein